MSTPPPPGWYAAPHANGEQRYWNGNGWIEPPATPAPSTATVVASRGRGWMVTAIVALAACLLLFILWIAALAARGAATSDNAVNPGGSTDSTRGDGASDLAAREQELDARGQQLDQREADVAAREEAAAGWVTTTLNDGIYTIGVSAEPGVYRTEDVGEYCQWHIYETGTGIYDLDGVLNFGAGEPGPIQVTLDQGYDFSSSDCGTWNRIG